MNMKPLLLGAVFAVSASLAANAATINSDFNYASSFLSAPGSYSVSFETGGKTWNVGDISFTANGSYADISQVTVTLSSTGESYQLWTPGKGTTASLLADGFVTSDDFVISYVYGNAGKGAVLVNATFAASEVIPAVPAPAAGILLGTALLGLGAARRRKKN